MKIYTIANRVPGGHGEPEELHICRQAGWGTGSFPPAFTSWLDADSYRRAMDLPGCKAVVELEISVVDAAKPPICG